MPLSRKEEWIEINTAQFWTVLMYAFDKEDYQPPRDIKCLFIGPRLPEIVGFEDWLRGYKKIVKRCFLVAVDTKKLWKNSGFEEKCKCYYDEKYDCTRADVVRKIREKHAPDGFDFIIIRRINPRTEETAKQIIKNAYANLKKGGKLVLTAQRAETDMLRDRLAELGFEENKYNKYVDLEYRTEGLLFVAEKP